MMLTTLITPKKIILFFSLCLFFLSSFGQSGDLKKLEKYYQAQRPDTCLQLHKPMPGRVAQVVLIRHGEPNLYKKGWRKRKAAQHFAYAYDTVGIVPFARSPFCADSLPVPKIYHSQLARARHTAVLLFGDKMALEEDARFREFERKVFGFFNIKLPLKLWMGGSRVLWLMGLNDKGIENYKMARKRARENADFLGQQAESELMAVLVAHGFHNRVVLKYLRKSGWKHVYNGGKGYLSTHVMAKTITEK